MFHQENLYTFRDGVLKGFLSKMSMILKTYATILPGASRATGVMWCSLSNTSESSLPKTKAHIYK